MNRKTLYPALQALSAAVLFGASAPLSKLLLVDVEPVTLAALLYLGSGLSLWLVKRLRPTNSEAPIARTDWRWLAGAILAGGVAAPIVLMFSLRVTPASTASLLLSSETVATTLIAAFAFKEAIGGRAARAIALITLASVLLSWNTNRNWGFSPGAVGVLAACTLWGLDNNLTRHISAKDPLAIVTAKGLAAGLFSLALARVLNESFPSLPVMVGALAAGTLSYGLSNVLFVYAMRGLGASRTGALYATAPLAGMLLSFGLLRDSLNPMFILALPLMGVGTWLLINEDHLHAHYHTPLEHDHRHEHADGHHVHEHEAPVASGSTHTHLHQHLLLEHTHGHLPDTHHRHTHSAKSGR